MTPFQIQQLAQQLAGLMAQLMLLFLLAFVLKSVLGYALKGSWAGLPKGWETEREKGETAMMPHVERAPALGEGKIATPPPSPSEGKFEIRYLPDSYEQCEESMRRTGMKEGLRKAFEEAKARVRSKSK